ncbi:hypothetical protein [Shewanella sp. 10N.286.48.A6]|uniref:hypothetical protein n=1 Tax=Shewanella sp. 10N.286.48.A6 TaxID=1880833 RepID=UPI000C854C7E|nr:hypothetical protein [Shewanella sp. 10N.286.48.A6]PMH96290.1 hypothetical protein BCU55_19385 [Shewanella sp. 10N.286.48.A6]
MSNKRSGNKHRGRHVIRFYSKKAGCALQLDSYLELSLALKLEINPNVSRYAAQPESMHSIMYGKKCRYSPDFLVTYSDGFEEYLEVHHVDFTTTEYNKKIAHFNQYAMEATGVGIRLITAKGINEVELHNHQLISENYLLNPIFIHEDYNLPDQIKFGELISQLTELTQSAISEAYTLLASGIYQFNKNEYLNSNSLLHRKREL